nr:ORF2 [Anelloviridae sp.]
MDTTSQPKTGTVIWVTATKLWVKGVQAQHNTFCTCGDLIGHLTKWLSHGDSEGEQTTNAGDPLPGEEDIEGLLQSFAEDSER